MRHPDATIGKMKVALLVVGPGFEHRPHLGDDEPMGGSDP